MLKALTVTINGQCQLHCPHCYIDMAAWPKTIMPSSVIDSIDLSKYYHVAVVATEPFFDKNSLAATMHLARRAKAAGKTFSVITNTLGLERALILEPELAELLTWVDISMDVAGEEGYKKYRGGSWRKFLSGVHAARNLGIEVTILNTVSSDSLQYFEEMIRVSEELSTNLFTVSPIIMATSRSTPYRTGPLSSLKDFLLSCANSEEFKKSTKVKLDIGVLTCVASGEDISELIDYSKELGIDRKATFFVTSPDEAIDRILEDGTMVKPSQTLAR